MWTQEDEEQLKYLISKKDAIDKEKPLVDFGVSLGKAISTFPEDVMGITQILSDNGTILQLHIVLKGNAISMVECL